MKEKKKIYPNPKFDNVVDEDKYWKTHSPLAEGYTAEIQKEKQKRSSFLTIRLTGEELTHLRDLASSKGMGPSTYIRALIKDALTPVQSAELTLSESAQRFQSVLQRLAYDKKTGGTTAVKDKTKEQYRAFDEAFYVLQLSKAPLKLEIINNLSAAISDNILHQMIPSVCVKVITPGDAEFDEMKRMANEQTSKAKK
ncbi:MAG: hypothetical protein JW901_07515 [Dehalococcoidia bacterium]|nr:hypothetical protein [Dehalococcoidia bacterium]